MIAPARAEGAYAVMGALRMVLLEEQLQEAAMLRQDLERTRMELEDARRALVSPYPATQDPRGRCLTWQEWGEGRQEVLDRLEELWHQGRQEVIDRIEELHHPIAPVGLGGDDDDAVDESMESDDDDDDEEDEGIVCVLCLTYHDDYTGEFFYMVPQGHWAGLAPGARIVCSYCYRGVMGEIESVFP